MDRLKSAYREAQGERLPAAVVYDDYCRAMAELGDTPLAYLNFRSCLRTALPGVRPAPAPEGSRTPTPTPNSNTNHSGSGSGVPQGLELEHMARRDGAVPAQAPTTSSSMVSDTDAEAAPVPRADGDKSTEAGGGGGAAAVASALSDAVATASATSPVQTETDMRAAHVPLADPSSAARSDDAAEAAPQSASDPHARPDPAAVAASPEHAESAAPAENPDDAPAPAHDVVLAEAMPLTAPASVSDPAPDRAAAAADVSAAAPAPTPAVVEATGEEVDIMAVEGETGLDPTSAMAADAMITDAVVPAVPCWWGGCLKAMTAATTADGLRAHVADAHCAHAQEGDGPWRCQWAKCTRALPTHALLLAHVQTHLPTEHVPVDVVAPRDGAAAHVPPTTVSPRRLRHTDHSGLAMLAAAVLQNMAAVPALRPHFVAQLTTLLEWTASASRLAPYTAAILAEL
jgi:hypothetical protein